MKAYLIRRCLMIFPTFIGISLVTFLLIQLAPGSPIYTKLRGAEGALSADRATQDIIEQTKALYGLDKPIPVQYALWLGRLATLNFGNSYKDQRPVTAKIFEAIPVTLQFQILSILLSYMIAIPLGVYSATHPRTWIDNLLTLLTFFLFSLPSFWVAMLLIMFFGGGDWLNWFPVHGLNSVGAATMSWPQWIMDRLWHMTLPLIVFTYGAFAVTSRYMRTGMLDVIRQDYIRTARAYGFSERVVVWKYAMRNSLIPIITQLGYLLPALIGGSIIIESIFSIPGMGRLAFEAMLFRDYPLIMGTFSISALLTLAGLILSDLLYALVDPRIQFE